MHELHVGGVFEALARVSSFEMRKTFIHDSNFFAMTGTHDSRSQAVTYERVFL